MHQRRAQTALLLVPLGGILLALRTESLLTTGVVAGLVLFGVVFAINSAVHSHLIVAYAEAERVALRVGFYYTANALGRLFGTLLSGSLFQLAAEPAQGLANCIMASSALVVLSALSCWPLRRAEARQAAPRTQAAG